MSKFFINRPIVAMVIAIITVIVGSVAILGLPVSQYPDITPPRVKVSTTYTGANAISVEKSVATPLEEKINGVENSIYMQSINANDGTMTINVSFEVGTDPDMDNVFTQNKVSAATPKLPEEVKKFGVDTKKAMAFPLLLVTLSSPEGTFDKKFLSNYAKINVNDVLARIPGIGEVMIFGAADYAMRFWIKPDRLASLGMTVPELIGSIKEQNVIVPGGQFGGEPAPPGTEFTYNVLLKGRLETEKEFGNIVVRTNPNGSQVKLKDVARIELGAELYNSFTRLNEKDAAVVVIYQTPGSNALDIADKVKSNMVDLEQKFPQDLEYSLSLDTTLAITAGIKDIIITLIEALALVILVVFIFLQDWRSTIIPSIAIPVSLIGAFILFPMLGFSVNVLSLLGLVLAIGIVVDDAIIVVEAVTVNIEKGMNPKEATRAAMDEVSGPVVATTLVLMAVFVPVAFVPGITGALYQQFAITIAVSVGFSSINALTLSPALCSLLLRKKEESKGIMGRFFHGFNTGFEKVTHKYLGLTTGLLHQLKRAALGVAIVVGLFLFFASRVPGGFIPEEDMGYFLINVQLPEASSLQRSDEIARKVEEILRGEQGVEYYTTITGFSMLSGIYSTSSAFLFVSCTDWDERPGLTAEKIVQNLNKKFTIGIPGAIAIAFGPPAIPGLGNGAGFSIFIQDKGGNEAQYLDEHVKEYVKAIRVRQEIGTAFSLFTSGVPQRFMDIDRDKALKLGIPLSDVYSTVGAFLGGNYINDFNRFGRLYKTYIQAEPEYRTGPEQMSMFFLKTAEGEMVPLSSIAKVRAEYGPEYTNRFNLFRAAEVTGAPAPGYTSSQALAALEEEADKVLPADMGYAWNAMSYQEKAAEGGAAVIFLFSLIFVFLILSAQYESWSLPISILMGIPFALFGAFFGLWFARNFSETYESNIFAQIGLVLLIALAAKNAILIVEFAKIKFEEGMSLVEAAKESAKLRFRPILMTSFSFLLGVVPLLIASGSGSEARRVLGVDVFAGMLFATFFGVFFTPALFVIVGKLFGYEKKRDLEAAKKLET
jgi:multidrug efflux pump